MVLIKRNVNVFQAVPKLPVAGVVPRNRYISQHKNNKIYIGMPLLPYFKRLRAVMCSLVGLSILVRVPEHQRKYTSIWCIELVKTPWKMVTYVN